MAEEPLKTCQASQLVARLQAMIAEHGDLPIFADDPDTGFRLPIGLIHSPRNEDYPERFEITTEWDDEPEGYIEPFST